MSTDPFSEDDVVLIEDVVEPLIGYRSWDVQSILAEYTVAIKRKFFSPINQAVHDYAITPRLSAMFGPYWEPGDDQEATCHAPGSACTTCPSPPVVGDLLHPGRRDGVHAGYGCGLYAFKSLETAVAKNTGMLISSRVTGRVLLWGRVFEHSGGYRAQYARIDGFYNLHKAIYSGYNMEHLPGLTSHNEPIYTVAQLATQYDVPLLELEDKVRPRRTFREAFATSVELEKYLRLTEVLTDSDKTFLAQSYPSLKRLFEKGLSDG